MKANEAPEKIYVTECMVFMTNPEITLSGGNKIEYTRTDAFIEKACEFLKCFADENGMVEEELSHITETLKSYLKGE